MKRVFWKIGIVVVVAAAAVSLIAMPWQARASSGVSHLAVPATVTGKALPPAPVVASMDEAFERAAQAIRPSVVSITSTRTVHSQAMQGFPGMPDNPLNDFFGHDNPLERFFSQPAPTPHSFHESGLGSGVIVSPDGFILTNNHVVEGADELTVQLHDNRQFKAKVVGRDAKTDIAVVKINADNLTPAMLGNSDDVKVGQWVMAAGSPFGLRETVSAGIISATGRSNMGIEDYEDFLQTDAAINPGNSGGALINLQGQVIGINTAIMSRSGGFQGIGFAIPINMAHQVMNELVTSGKVTRSWLGVVIQPLTPELASSFGYKGNGTVLISDVTPDSPAAHAGLKSGDIIVALNGKPVDELASFRNHIAEAKAGTKVKLDIWRDGKDQAVTVDLAEMPAQMAGATGEPGVPLNMDQLGLQLSDLTPQLEQQFHLKAGTVGAIVVAVEPGSAAQRAGLRPGDAVTQVQHQTVRSAAEAQALLGKADLKKGVRMRVRSGGMEHYVMLVAGD